MTWTSTGQLLIRLEGYNYFDKYDEPQLKSTVELVKWLCETFGIRKSLFDHFDYDVTVLEPDGGIFTHTHVRRDKSDLSGI